MRKILPFYLCLLGILFSSFSLAGADFTVKGKVSVITESVPLPFYEVNIADEDGKYIATATTSFTGRYSHTFDIPSGENVKFEVSVIDQCTGNPLVVGFEMNGTKEVVNFLVCEQDLGIDEGEETDTDDDDDDDEENEGNGLPDFINCEALGLDISVCAEDKDGNTIEYPSACAAIEAGVKLHDLQFCEGGGTENGIAGTFNCDQLGIDLPINVCVFNAAQEQIIIPLCEALAEGYPLSQIEFCEDGDLSSLADLDSLDCEGLGINLPVCGTDANGIEVTFDTPCAALDSGIELSDLTICDDFIANGLDNLDCESLGLDLDIPVCTINEAGEQVELMLCEALTQGISLDNVELCDGALDGIDCSDLPVDLPVCATDADGNELNFDNPCDAIAAGLGINELTFCDGLVDGILDNLDCESLGMEVDIPVCTINEAGEQVELMLCEALTQGISLDNVELCDGALDGIDCAGLGVNLPVCATDADGNELNFDNPCDAIAAGLGINELTFCDGLVDGILDNLDCDDLGFELPIPVCVTNSVGEQEELNLCDALSQGISPENIEVCSNTFEGLGVDAANCEGLGLNIPVCIIDATGNTVKFDNPCAALDAGWKIDDFDFCDNLLEDVMAAAFNTTPTEEEKVLIERADLYPNPANKTITLDLKIAESAEYEVSIQSINGNAIYRQKYHTKNGGNVTNMDVSSLSTGIYVVKVTTANSVRAMKFIKQ